jgi:hypothetical protein
MEWPRRPPSKYNYSPEVCPKLKATEGKDGVLVLTNMCTGGRSCPYAHSREEVLYHPLIFKATRCEEHASLSKDNEKRKNQKHVGKKRCHRYYCPFAHGDQEVRTSTLDIAQIHILLSKVDIFLSGDCCKFCVQPFRKAVTMEATPQPQPYFIDAKQDPFARSIEEMIARGLPPILSTAPQPWSDLLELRQARDQAAQQPKDDVLFAPSMSPFGLASLSTISPSSPLSKASDEHREDSIPMMKDLPPPLKIHLDGYGGTSIAPIFPTLGAQLFREQMAKEMSESKDDQAARIYAML